MKFSEFLLRERTFWVFLGLLGAVSVIFIGAFSYGLHDVFLKDGMIAVRITWSTIVIFIVSMLSQRLAVDCYEKNIYKRIKEHGIPSDLNLSITESVTVKQRLYIALAAVVLFTPMALGIVMAYGG